MEGLPVRHGEELMLADDPEAFADEVCALMEEPERGDALGKRAADRVRRDFGWASVSADFARICEEAGGATNGAAARKIEKGMVTCV